MVGISPWGPGKVPNKFLKIFFDKSIGKCVCVAKRPCRLVYMVTQCW